MFGSKKLAGKKKVLFWPTVTRTFGLLILLAIIIIILISWGVWNVLTIPDKIFIVAAGLVLAIILGTKREQVV
jgi:hypothetical protein